MNHGGHYPKNNGDPQCDDPDYDEDEDREREEKAAELQKEYRDNE